MCISTRGHLIIIYHGIGSFEHEKFSYLNGRTKVESEWERLRHMYVHLMLMTTVGVHIERRELFFHVEFLDRD